MLSNVENITKILPGYFDLWILKPPRPTT
jgi:hypothetical protein